MVATAKKNTVVLEENQNGNVIQSEGSVTTKKVIDMSKYNGLTTKSAKIRAMNADGHTRSEIAAALGILYQHVRNVLTQPLKKPAAVAETK